MVLEYLFFFFFFFFFFLRERDLICTDFCVVIILQKKKEKRLSNNLFTRCLCTGSSVSARHKPSLRKFSFQRTRKGEGAFFHAPRFLFHLLDLLEKGSMGPGQLGAGGGKIRSFTSFHFFRISI